MVAPPSTGEFGEVEPNFYSSNIVAIITAFVGIFVIRHNLGYVTDARGGYIVVGERYVPKMGFISYQRQHTLTDVDGYIPNAPDLAVEVVPSTKPEQDTNIKIANYLAAGTVVWRARPLEQQIAVFAPGTPVIILGINDILDGGEILPGFMLPLKDIFRTPPAN